MKRITITALALALTLCAGCATKIAESQDELPTARYESAFLAVNDVDGPTVIQRIAVDVEAAEAERIAAEEAAAAEAAADELETYHEEDHAWVESYAPSYSGDGFMQQGIREGVDSDTETWYSSARAYHKDTANWSTDGEGYYRTSDGYYVVASNDYEYGTVIETSKGQAQVLDDGTWNGNVDFYVAWEC